MSQALSYTATSSTASKNSRYKRADLALQEISRKKRVNPQRSAEH
jgi:hypothetical protein